MSLPVSCYHDYLTEFGVTDPISLETTYPANVLEDHTGPQFERHQVAQLVQRDNVGIDKKLILPWDVNSTFKPGTLVIAMIVLRIWNLDKRVSRFRT